MLKINLINALAEPFPNKVYALNAILEIANSKELFETFEFLVDFIFSSSFLSNNSSIGSFANVSSNADINNNRTVYQQNNECVRLPNWPLKLTNRTQHGLEYDCMFSFLNSSSPFWQSIFKLDHMNATFTINCNSLPANVKQRIENGQSYFSPKVDAFNMISLTALDYFLFYFFMLAHDTRATSRRVYDDTYGNIELDSLYGDLLSDYMNFFLPVTERGIRFPSFANAAAQAKPVLLMPQLNAQFQQPNSVPIRNLPTFPINYNQHTSLLKRHVQQRRGKTVNDLADSNVYDEDSLNDADSCSMSNEPRASNRAYGLERTENLRKIDSFLQFVNELLVLPFSNPVMRVVAASTLSPPGSPTKAGYGFNSPLGMKNVPPNGYSRSVGACAGGVSSSPIKYKELARPTLANMEIVFALSMVLKHSHLFANAFASEVFSNGVFPTETERGLKGNWNQSVGFDQNVVSNSRRLSQQIQNELILVDELRSAIFKNYWRKSFYKFFEFHLEHLSLTPNIKWFLELWLTYIQPWKFTVAPPVTKPQDQSSPQPPQLPFPPVAHMEFLVENFPLITDVYHLILKRYCIVDLTSLENLRVVKQILTVFAVQKDELKKCNSIYVNVARRLCQQTRPDYQLVKHNSEFRAVTNTLADLDKSPLVFKSLSCTENLRIIMTFNENLANSKHMLKDQLSRKLKKHKQGVWDSIRDSLFSEESQDNALSRLSSSDLDQIAEQVNDCSCLLQDFYQSMINFDEPPASNLNQTPVNIGEQSDASITQNGQRLTPQDRFKIINGLKKPKIVMHYDPETAPVGDMELGILVFILSLLSNQINLKLSNEFSELYARSDIVGRLARSVLYVPTGKSSDDQQLQPRLSLRRLASYQFIVYFFALFTFLKLVSGFSLQSTFLLVSAAFLVYSLLVTVTTTTKK